VYGQIQARGQFRHHPVAIPWSPYNQPYVCRSHTYTWRNRRIPLRPGSVPGHCGHPAPSRLQRSIFCLVNGRDRARLVMALQSRTHFPWHAFHPGWLLHEKNRSDPDKLDKMTGSHSTQGTSEIGNEEYILGIVGPMEDYLLPLTLELGWTLNIDGVWKLATPIYH